MASEEELQAFLDAKRKEIERMVKTDINAAKNIENLLEDIEDELVDDYGIDPYKVDEYLDPLTELTLATNVVEQYYNAIKEGSWDLIVNNRRVTKKRIVETRLAGNKVEIVVKGEQKEKELRERLEKALFRIKRHDGAESEQQKMFVENLEILIEEMSEAAKYSRAYVRPRQVRVDSYLGGLSLKKQSNREAIYDYWENISKLYDDVALALSVIGEISDDESEISEELKELKEFDGRDLSYVLELNPNFLLL